MKTKYRHSIEYIRNRATKIARNRNRRNRYDPTRKHRLLDPFLSIKVSMPTIVKLFSNGIGVNRNVLHLSAPTIFNLTLNCDETLDFIVMIASYFETRLTDFSLTLDFDKCINIDIGSLAILDLLIDRANKYFKAKNIKCSINGKYPTDMNAKYIFGYSGLPKVFGTNYNGNSIITLDPLLSENDTNTEVHRIINYYNDCLKSSGYELNKNGFAMFNALINEIIDNAIIHCGFKTPLYVSGGYYNDNDKKGQLSIVSFGNTLYKSLSSDDTDAEVKNRVKSIEEVHKRLNYNNYSKNGVWSICALQSGISCMKNQDDLDRGNGTIKFIEAFLKYGQSLDSDKKPIMSIVTGDTLIKFDGKYALKEDEKGHKIIAFNEQNSLHVRPDPNYVFKNKNSFPGVAINIEFYIDQNILERYRGDDDE